MAHFRTSIETDASAQAAFDYLSDFSNTRHWDPTVEGARTLTPGPIGEGTRFEVRLARPGGSLRFEYIITRFEPSRRLVLEAQTKLLRSLDTIEIEPLAHGCRVRYDADLRLRGAAYLFDLPVHLAFQISGARSVKGLEEALEELSAQPRLIPSVSHRARRNGPPAHDGPRPEPK